MVVNVAAVDTQVVGVRRIQILEVPPNLCVVAETYGRRVGWYDLSQWRDGVTVRLHYAHLIEKFKPDLPVCRTATNDQFITTVHKTKPISPLKAILERSRRDDDALI